MWKREKKIRVENYYFIFGNMSKIGYKPITVPSGVTVSLAEDSVEVKGQKGTLTIDIPSSISIQQEEDIIKIDRSDETRSVKAKHGLVRSLIANAIYGVDKLWQKKLLIVGTGYNAKMQGQDIVLKLGFSHPVIIQKIEGVQLQTEGNNTVVVSGINKQLVGEVAYQIKMKKKPDPYKGKGIRLENDVIRLKPGKKAKA